MTTDWAGRERADLLDLLAGLGPDAPTLLPGWRTLELAAHLVVRERQPIGVAGLVVPPLRGVTARLERRAAERPYDDLLATLRSGPPPWSAGGALRGPLAGLTDLHEFFVHHEDVRRVDDRAPRSLPEQEESALWTRVRAMGPALLLRARGLGVVVTTPDGRRATLRAGRHGVVLDGTPGELLLWLFGRREIAHVSVTGSAEAKALAASVPLGA